MKSKHDSSSDSRDSASIGAGKNDDSMSESGDRSRSNSPSSKKDRSSKGLLSLPNKSYFKNTLFLLKTINFKIMMPYQFILEMLTMRPRKMI